jgi:hypothetical protein
MKCPRCRGKGCDALNVCNHQDQPENCSLVRDDIEDQVKEDKEDNPKKGS